MLALWYTLVAVIWILFSDHLLFVLAGDPGQITAIQNVKGLGFVVTSGLALFGLVVRDRRNRERAAEELRAAELRALRAEKLRALGQMASGVAHDLNQSLAIITGYSDLAKLALADPSLDRARLDQIVSTIGQAAHDGGETVRRLLTFARVSPDEARERVDVRDLLEGVARLTAPRWRDTPQSEGRPIRLVVEVEGRPIVEGQAASLREALTNLVFNAVDALPAGGDARLRARVDGDRVLIEVADTGIGMTGEVQQRVFEPFFTTKGERGTGLGLPMVFAVVSQHGGTIDVSSQPQRGTTFRISLPLAPSPSEDQQALPVAAPDARLSSLRILVVDDEERIAGMLALLLERDGHAATIANSGEEALRVLKTQRFDLVISDLSLGKGMNGWELVRQGQEAHPGLAFGLATGWGAQLDASRAREQGIEFILPKPYRLSDVQRAIRQALEVCYESPVSSATGTT